MALRNLATRMREPAAALRRHPGPGVPPPPSLSRFLGRQCFASMAHRSLATRIWGPAASALRRHPGLDVPPPPPAAAVPCRFVATVHKQNDITIREIAIRRTPFDVERIRDDVKRYKVEDEIMRENLSWASRYYKTMEWTCYVLLSVSTVIVIACEVDVRSRKKDEGHLQAGLICEQ